MNRLPENLLNSEVQSFFNYRKKSKLKSKSQDYPHDNPYRTTQAGSSHNPGSPRIITQNTYYGCRNQIRTQGR